MAIHSRRAKTLCTVKLGCIPENRLGRFKDEAKYLGRINAKVITFALMQSKKVRAA